MRQSQLGTENLVTPDSDPRRELPTANYSCDTDSRGMNTDLLRKMSLPLNVDRPPAGRQTEGQAR